MTSVQLVREAMDQVAIIQEIVERPCDVNDEEVDISTLREKADEALRCLLAADDMLSEAYESMSIEKPGRRKKDDSERDRGSCHHSSDGVDHQVISGTEKGTMTMREELASLMHDMWSGWRRYVSSKSTLNLDGTMTIPAWAVERWKRQMNTPYADLSEKEKDSDRREADKVLALIEKCVWEHSPGSLVDLSLFQSYYEKQEPVTVPADILQCHGCGKPSSSLSTWTIKDDEGEKIVWLCESCQSTKNLTEEYREDAGQPVYEVVRSSNTWNVVLGALGRLYELHSQPHETDTHMAVEELMDTYERWLD